MWYFLFERHFLIKFAIGKVLNIEHCRRSLTNFFFFFSFWQAFGHKTFFFKTSTGALSITGLYIKRKRIKCCCNDWPGLNPLWATKNIIARTKAAQPAPSPEELVGKFFILVDPTPTLKLRYSIIYQKHQLKTTNKNSTKTWYNSSMFLSKQVSLAECIRGFRQNIPREEKNEKMPVLIPLQKFCKKFITL